METQPRELSDEPDAHGKSGTPEPIPLRTLTMLLNYERMISDPKFVNTQLLESSSAIGTTVYKYMTNYPTNFLNDPLTIRDRNVNVFALAPADSVQERYPSTFVSIHPDATPGVQKLSLEVREAIFYESRAYNGSIQAIALFQAFFDLCPPDQQISIQLRDEPPIFIPASQRFYLTWKFHSPTLRTFTITPHRPVILSSGSLPQEIQCTMGFWCPSTLHRAVFVDMARLHYTPLTSSSSPASPGGPGGLYGETFFIGTHNPLFDSLRGGARSLSSTSMYHTTRLRQTNSACEARMAACAQRVFERWQKRNEEHWCAVCGKGGDQLFDCPGCPPGKEMYCCVEHMQRGWMLHELSCSGKQFGGD